VPTIDSSIGGVASNSYVSLLEADAYFDSVYGKTLWDAALENIKQQLLISATGALDQFFQWEGQKYTIDQALEWPRVNAYDRSGTMYSYTTIPNIIKVATYELAYHMLANGGLVYDQNRIDEVKVGSIAVKFTSYITETGIPKSIEAMLSHIGMPLFIDGNKMTMAKLERV
jgi:hypothetical protein